MRVALAVSVAMGLAAAAAAAEQAVPWSEAGAHVGRVVLVEGFVRRVRRDGRHLTLLFDPDDPRALRATLLIPFVTDLPPEPEALYRERRVRIRGRITRTAGHLDVIVTDPDRISVSGLTTDAPAPPELPPAARPSPRADAAARAEATCRRLAASRDATRSEALDAVATLRDCLEAGRSGCIAATDAIAPPVTRLEWIEQELRTRCPSGP